MAASATLIVETAGGPRITVRSPKALERRSAMPEAFDRTRCGVRIEGCRPVASSAWGSALATLDDGDVALRDGSGPFFFDQTDYMFELTFPPEVEVEEARLFSPIAAWCDRCVWSPEDRRLGLPVNFGNDLGDFEIVFEWRPSADGEWRSLTFASRVFSTKLDVGHHVPAMIAEVENRFAWMRLDLARSTLWNWRSDDARDGSLQTWLAVFREVRDELSASFRELTRRHRRRLTPVGYRVRADRIRRTSPRLEEHIAERLEDRPDARFAVTRKHLDGDTPENRYMKHILRSCIGMLAEVGDRIARVERISDVFKARLREWEDEWSILLNHPFWRGIGAFHGLRRESLVLSQDPLYARTRRNWIHLQHGVSLLDGDLRGGLQNVAQLYEIWCLVQLDRFVSRYPDPDRRDWNFDERASIPFAREDDDFASDEWRVGTLKLAYQHARTSDVRLDLLFQPTAGRKPDHRYWDGMMSLPERQCPDLVLRVHRGDLPGRPTFTWIFDAKYRLALDANGSQIGAPRDAIDAMHRYRDAILWAADSQGRDRPTREALGAFVLYPGEEEMAKGSHQLESVERVNVGAFSLRPADADASPADVGKMALGMKLAEMLHIQDLDEDRPWRLGESQRHYDAVPRVRQGDGEETLHCAVRSHMESEAYWKSCRLYRLPIEREADVYRPARSWGYIVPTASDGTTYGRFPIRGSAILPRKEIVKIYEDYEVHIPADHAKADKLYRLFWLDEPSPVAGGRPLAPGTIIEVQSEPDQPDG